MDRSRTESRVIPPCELSGSRATEAFPASPAENPPNGGQKRRTSAVFRRLQRLSQSPSEYPHRVHRSLLKNCGQKLLLVDRNEQKSSIGAGSRAVLLAT